MGFFSRDPYPPQQPSWSQQPSSQYPPPVYDPSTTPEYSQFAETTTPTSLTRRTLIEWVLGRDTFATTVVTGLVNTVTEALSYIWAFVTGDVRNALSSKRLSSKTTETMGVTDVTQHSKEYGRQHTWRVPTSHIQTCEYDPDYKLKSTLNSDAKSHAMLNLARYPNSNYLKPCLKSSSRYQPNPQREDWLAQAKLNFNDEMRTRK